MWGWSSAPDYSMSWGFILLYEYLPWLHWLRGSALIDVLSIWDGYMDTSRSCQVVKGQRFSSRQTAKRCTNTTKRQAFLLFPLATNNFHNASNPIWHYQMRCHQQVALLKRQYFISLEYSWAKHLVSTTNASNDGDRTLKGNFLACNPFRCMVSLTEPLYRVRGRTVYGWSQSQIVLL